MPVSPPEDRASLASNADGGRNGSVAPGGRALPSAAAPKVSLVPGLAARWSERAPWAAVLLTLAIVGAAWTALLVARGGVLTGVQGQAAATAGAAAGHVRQVLLGTDAVLASLLEALPAGEPRARDAARLEAAAAERADLVEGVLGFALLDAAGRVVGSHGLDARLHAAVADAVRLARPLPASATAGGSSRGEPRSTGPGGAPRGRVSPLAARDEGPGEEEPGGLMALSRPIAGESGAVGTAVAVLRGASLLGTFDGLLGTSGGTVALLRAEAGGALLAGRGDERLLTQLAGGPGPEGGGEPWRLAFREVPEFELIALAALPTAGPLERWRALAGPTMLAAGLFGALTVGAALALRGQLRERAAHAERLGAAEAELRQAHRVAALGHFRRDLVTGRLEWSEGVHDVFGTDPARFVPTREFILERVHPDDREGWEAATRRAYAAPGEPVRHEWRVVRPDGSVRWVWAEHRIELDPATGAPVALRGVVQDVTRRREAEEQARRLAQHDALTGLANRALLRERLEAALARAARDGSGLALLYLDLDGFKSVNDRWGHGAGDRLLREAARRVRDAAREDRDLVARLGGDEFVVLMGAVPADAARAAEAASALAGRLTAAMALPYDLGEGREGRVTASVGIALAPRDASDPDALLECADTALYRRKAAGRDGHALFTPEMDEAARDARALEQDLRQALGRGELSLAWQPQALASEERRAVGFEALLRWAHPTRGPVRPDLFIPAAEASGTIVAIGEWVLRSACAEAARWPRPLRVAVNVSPVQVARGDLVEVVRGALAASGLAPHRLELEVTEGLLIRDVGRAREALAAVRAMGVRVALDDFGTGYSSLMTLRAFPFDKMKLDRSFILQMTEDAQAAAIVRGTLGLARGLALPVTAEGVETREQARALAADGCEEIQGWLVGKPLPIAEWDALTGRARPVLRAVAPTAAVA